MMSDLQRQNQEQMKDISAQLQTGLQAFLEQSMQQMMNKLTPAQPPATQATTAVIQSITPVSSLPTTQVEEPMDSTPVPPAQPQIKKGTSKIKGSSALAKQSMQAIVSQVTVPTTVPSSTPAATAATTIPRLSSPLQRLEQEEYGTDTSSTSLPTSKPAGYC